MTRIRRKLQTAIGSTILALSISISLPASALAAGNSLPSGIEKSKIGESIETYVEENKDTTVGMACSVFDETGILYEGYFGVEDKETGVVIDEETVFEWGSATKLMVWVSVMQLYEEGKLDLDTDIREYLPEDFLQNLNYDTTLTMKHLMNHSAGFQEVYLDIFWKEMDEMPELEEILRKTEPEQIYEPGTMCSYSNWGVALAGLIVERVSGVPFYEYVHEHIFNPLGMEHSALKPDLSDNPWVAKQRKELSCYTSEGELIEDCFYYIVMYPAGMCTSTMSDFQTFGKALLSKDERLMTKETWETFYTPTSYYGDTDIPQNLHGMWVEVLQIPVYGHGGNTMGCSSYVAISPETGTGMVVMTNQAYETVYNYGIMEKVFGEYDEQIYFPDGHEAADGIYRTMRCNRKGPVKIGSWGYNVGYEDTESFWIADKGSQVETIDAAYSDLVKISVWEMVFECALVIGWVLAALFIIIFCVCGGIKNIIGRLKNKESVSDEKRPEKLCYRIALIAEILLFVAIFLGVSLLSSLESVTAVTIALVGIFVIHFILLVDFIFGCSLLKKKCITTGKQRVYHVLMCLALLINLANVWYWELYQFWFFIS